MLASLLRWIIFVLFLVGAGVGYGLAQWGIGATWVVLLIGTLWPFLTLLLIVITSMVKSRNHEGALRWWQTLFMEYLAGVHIFLLRQPWTWGTPGIQKATAQAAEPRVPVVLVHGYMCNHRTWDDMVPALRAAGHTVMAVNLEPVFASIDSYATTIEAAVSALCKSTGTHQVALVGHSMGGVAIRAWMRQFGTHKVAQILTLGSPHVGTQIDPKPMTPNGRQMAWKSPWLTELAASESDATRALMRVALAGSDNIVYPQRAQTLPGVPSIVFDGMGHMQLCLEPQSIAWVCQQLASRAPSATPIYARAT